MLICVLDPKKRVVVPGVRSKSKKGRKRRLRILPDGRRIFATEEEAFKSLARFWAQKKLRLDEAEVIGRPPNRTRDIRVLPSERIEIDHAIATLERSDKTEKLIRRRDEEEAIVLMLLH